jgi:hypothetical protein
VLRDDWTFPFESSVVTGPTSIHRDPTRTTCLLPVHAPVKPPSGDSSVCIQQKCALALPAAGARGPSLGSLIAAGCSEPSCRKLAGPRCACRQQQQCCQVPIIPQIASDLPVVPQAAATELIVPTPELVIPKYCEAIHQTRRRPTRTVTVRFSAVPASSQHSLV